MKSKIREGFVVCPGCGYKFKIGTFEGCRNISMDGPASQVESYKDIEMYRVLCPECGLRFHAHCSYHFLTRLIYE